MGKRINAEKVQPLLIYPDNLSFLMREVKLPHSSNEIMNNLRTRMGGTIAFEQNPMQGTIVYGSLLILCIIAWIIAGGVAVAQLRFLEEARQATGLTLRSKAWMNMGLAALGVCAALLSITWFVAKTLFKAMRYSPAKMKQSYALILHQGNPIKGAIVSSAFVSGTHVITYQFTNPKGETIKCDYRSPRVKYKKGEVINGKSVLVWYLDDKINTLL